MRINKWVKKIAIGISTLVVLLLFTTFTYEQISRIVARNNYKPEGEFIDVGGHSLHYYEQGEGGPTVVFESGLDHYGHLSWYKVQTEISRYTTTVSYDRAGILWSERGNNPKTASAIESELTALLENGNFPKPYILVGHSLAGITLRPFVANNADDIASVILVDASHPDQWNRFPPEIAPPSSSLLLKMMESFGFHRFISPSPFPNTIAEDRINVVGFPVGLSNTSAVLDELVSSEAMAAEAMQVDSFEDIPITVITATSPVKSDILPEEYRQDITRIWNELQEDHLQLSPNHRQILAANSTHYVQLEEPDIVISAILYSIEQFGR